MARFSEKVVLVSGAHSDADLAKHGNRRFVGIFSERDGNELPGSVSG